VEALQNLAFGFAVALTPQNLLWCFVGAFVGTIIGMLPGIGPPGAIAMLLPLTFKLDPLSALIMLAGIYYGAKYGGSTTSILLNMPGEPSSVVTCLDGYQMARQGRAGPALGIAAIASFIAGTFGVVGLMLAAPPLARFALRFAPPEYFAVMCLGMTMVAFLTGESVVKGLMTTAVGIWLGIIGTDLFTAQSRYTFGQIELVDGIDFVVVSIGLFSIAEVLMNMESTSKAELFPLPKGLRNLLPNLQDLKDCRFAVVNGTLVGFFVGLLPGAGATVASMISYGIEKAVSRCPGIPGSNVGAMLLAALYLWGLRPGPLLIQEHPELFWGVVASMYIGNFFLLILNLPMVPLFVQILRLPYFVIYPLVLGISIVGVFSINNSYFDVWLMGLFGLLGYFFRKLDFPLAPLLLGMVLGKPAERSLRQSLMMSQGNFMILFTRPISLTVLLIAVSLLLIPIIRVLYSGQRKVV
jgi:putative tricarboxylic transport membrane protein